MNKNRMEGAAKQGERVLSSLGAALIAGMAHR
jgi:hypothetical protein